MASRLPRIRKSVLTLALPVTVSSLLQRAEGIVAVFLVGGLGASSIAAVGLGQLLAFIATTLVSGLSVGANVLIAQLWGARRTKDVGEAATHLLGLAAIISCMLMALGWSLNRVLMNLLGAENDVISLALPYSNLIFLVIPCTIFLQVLSSIMQGTGDTKTPMYALIVINLLYLTIAYPLIYGLWGFPAWGITGAAVATGVAEAAGVVYLLWACRTLFKKSFHIRYDLLRSTWQIGASVSGERMFQQTGIILYTKIVLLYGTVTYAAHQVGLSIESLSFLPGYGFAIAAATMVGRYRRGKVCRAKLETGSLPYHDSHGRNGRPLLFFPPTSATFTNDEAVSNSGRYSCVSWQSYRSRSHSPWFWPARCVEQAIPGSSWWRRRSACGESAYRSR
jgi:putative MATE family efflux protein